jgi:hypothetical protein
MNSRLRFAVQLAGFAISLALLAWCLSRALTPENRQQLDNLWAASPAQIAGLLLLSLLTLTINGTIFWAVLRPVRRLHLGDMLATNAMATFLSYLPFKASALFRVLMHNRRDRVPVLTIGAWFAAIAVLLLVALAPAALAAAWRQQIDTLWLFATVGGQVVLSVLLLVTARTLRGETGQDRMVNLAQSLHLRPLSRVLASRSWANLHAGFDMLACPRVVIASTVLRLADIAVLAGRFTLAATIFGIALPLDQAILISLSHFMIGVLSPFGVLGAREAGATGIAAFLASGTEASDPAGAFAAVVLLVSATEGMVYLMSAAAGLAWLRPDRLLRARTAPPQAQEPHTSIRAEGPAHAPE